MRQRDNNVPIENLCNATNEYPCKECPFMSFLCMASSERPIVQLDHLYSCAAHLINSD